MGRPDPNGCGATPAATPDPALVVGFDGFEMASATTIIRLDAEGVVNLARGGSMQVGDVAIEGAPERECMCGTAPTPHEYGCEGCEYHDHHCETCHRDGNCTAEACGFPSRPSTRPKLVQLPPEVLAAAAELRRLSETPTGRDAARARAATYWHMDNCATCAPAAKAQAKAGRRVVAWPVCRKRGNLMAAAEAAEKVHRDAEENRARLPLVLVAWIEGLT